MGNKKGSKRKPYNTKNKYYKNKYQIALYNEDETLCYLFDNVKQMTITLKGSTKHINEYQSRLSHFNKNSNNKIRHNNQWYYVEFIEVLEDE